MENKETDLIKDNIIKDRRRRYLYLSKDRTSGVQVMEQELAKFALLKKMSMWPLLVFEAVLAIARRIEKAVHLFIICAGEVKALRMGNLFGG